MAQSPGREDGDPDGISSVSSNSFTLSEATDQPPPEICTLTNTASLAEDLRVLTSSPELCDVIFLVGEDRVPVHGVKAILCARSKAFQKLVQSSAAVPKRPYRKLSDVKPPNIKSGLGNLRLFNRRASDTGHLTGEVPASVLNNPAPTSSPCTQIIIEEFDADVYRKLMEYIHTGSVTFETKSLIGLINAAEHYGLEELALSCSNYMRHCVTVNTVCDLLLSAEKYIQYKTTKVFIQKVMDFIDKNAESVLIQEGMTALPCHVLSLVLSREDVHASASSKFNAALTWSRAQLRKNQDDKDLKEIFAPFLDVIQFNYIPAATLMKEIKPLDLVPDAVIMEALAYQADPDSMPPPNPGSRRPSGRICTDEESIGSSSDLQDELIKLSTKANAI